MHPSEAKLMRLMKERRKALASELSVPLSMPKDAVGRVAYSLSKKNLLNIDKTEKRIPRLTPEGKDVLSNGLFEKRFLEKLPMMADGLSEQDQISLNWALRRGWVEIRAGKIVRIIESPPVTEEEISLRNFSELDTESPKFKMLKQRKWVEFRQDFDYTIEITSEGEKAEIEDETTQITSEMLKSGSWRTKKLMSFSPKTPVPPAYSGRFHPMNEIIEKIRRVFLEMGFTESEGPHVESAFWDFDALFVPQDHPAREMQDTFYMDGEEKLPAVSRKVAKVHTGLWGEWNSAQAQMRLLRTHMTTVSARMLSGAEPPAKIFTIGKVFRNETVDYKHLAEFHQVDGIVFDPDVNFNNLVGYLKDFYRKMGFDKIRIRPAYFPYTEMSAEVDVWAESRNNWMEMGGSGIFRPEVVKPLTGKDMPVLAWGLGVERIAMLRYGLSDIRELYKSSLRWLRNREVFM